MFVGTAGALKPDLDTLSIRGFESLGFGGGKAGFGSCRGFSGLGGCEGTSLPVHEAPR
jgi:hypothetical protein